MSAETIEWLNRNVLRGFTEKRGKAWHYSQAAQDGMEPNHYPGAIPVADLHRRLFGWKAEARSIFLDNGQPIGMNGADIVTGKTEIPGRKAWIRSDTGEVLGIHTDGYQGHQYAEWLVKNVETVLDDDLQVANAGLLKNGAIAWVQIEMPENIKTPEGVEFRPFLMATTSFDGSIATTYKRGFTDVVCDNTRATALREKGETHRVKHTRNSNLRIADTRANLGIVHSMAEDFAREIEILCNTTVTDSQWSRFLETFVPIEDGAKGRGVTMAENKRGELSRLWTSDVRVHPWSGTAWGVVQAVNTYVHHIGTVRGMGRVERNMHNAVTGKTDELDRNTMTVLEGVLNRELVAA